MSKSVQLKIDTSRFVKRVLGKLFEHADRAFSEAMQNSRRAGATHVSFQVAADPDDQTRSVVYIYDDGHGILDWDALLTVARSGWDAPLADREDAFGIGFAALLFGSRELLIRSRGRELRLSAEQAVEGAHFAVTETSTAPPKGTWIRLDGFRLNAQSVKQAIERFAAGFDIPVMLDDQPLPRPFAVDGKFIDSPVGKVWFPKGPLTLAEPYPSAAVFYQGLPIANHCQRFNTFNLGNSPSLSPHVVIHVDHSEYSAVAPDRGALCEPENFNKSFEAFFKAYWTNYLVGRSRVMDPEAFVMAYWRAVVRLGCTHLLQNCPLPSPVLGSLDGFPILADEAYFISGYSQAVTRKQVAAGEVILAAMPCDLDSDEAMAFLTLAGVKKFAIVKSLPDDHWATPYVIKLDEGDGEGWVVAVDAVPTMTAKFCGNWVDSEVALVDRYAISLVAPGATESPAVRERSFTCEEGAVGVRWNGQLLVPCKENGHMLVRQLSYYIDGNDEYREDDFEQDDGALQDLIAELRGRKPSATIATLLEEHQFKARRGITGAVCLVVVGDQSDADWHDRTVKVIDLDPGLIAADGRITADQASAIAEAMQHLAPVVATLKK